MQVRAEKWGLGSVFWWVEAPGAHIPRWRYCSDVLSGMR